MQSWVGFEPRSLRWEAWILTTRPEMHTWFFYSLVIHYLVCEGWCYCDRLVSYLFIHFMPFQYSSTGNLFAQERVRQCDISCDYLLDGYFVVQPSYYVWMVVWYYLWFCMSSMLTWRNYLKKLPPPSLVIAFSCRKPPSTATTSFLNSPLLH